MLLPVLNVIWLANERLSSKLLKAALPERACLGRRNGLSPERSTSLASCGREQISAPEAGHRRLAQQLRIQSDGAQLLPGAASRRRW